jgi:hypothetical protein
LIYVHVERAGGSAVWDLPVSQAQLDYQIKTVRVCGGALNTHLSRCFFFRNSAPGPALACIPGQCFRGEWIPSGTRRSCPDRESLHSIHTPCLSQLLRPLDPGSPSCVSREHYIGRKGQKEPNTSYQGDHLQFGTNTLAINPMPNVSWSINHTGHMHPSRAT